MLNGRKILFLLPSLEMGGSERQALMLADYLAERQGACVEIWGVHGQGLLVAECERRGFPWKVLDLRWPAKGVERLRVLAALAWTLRGAQPDIILPYTLLPSVACGCVWRMTGAKGCFWNQRDVLAYRMGARWECWAVRNVSGFVANSLHVGEYLQRTFAAPAGRIQIVPNGVEIPAPRRDRQQWRLDLQCGEADSMVVMVANLHRQKDHAAVLSAWRIVLDDLTRSNGSPVLVLAGLKGETYGELIEQAERLGLAGSVRFPGQVEDVAGLLAAADIGLFCSRSEGSPNGLLECMAAGLPVVSADIPGVREALGEGGDGVLSPPGDSVGMAANLLRLIRSPETRTRLGEDNRQRIRVLFSQEVMGQRMTDLMEACFRS